MLNTIRRSLRFDELSGVDASLVRVLLTILFQLLWVEIVRCRDIASDFLDCVPVLMVGEHYAELRVSRGQNCIHLLQYVLSLRATVKLLGALLDLELVKTFLEEDERGVDAILEHIAELLESLRVIDRHPDVCVSLAHHQVIWNPVPLPINVHYHFPEQQGKRSVGGRVCFTYYECSTLTSFAQPPGCLLLLSSCHSVFLRSIV